MRWSPDTCKCEFTFNPDPNDALNQILIAVVNTCEDHKGLSGTSLHQHVLKNENQPKNIIHAKLLEIDDMAEDVVTHNGEIIRKFKNGIDFDFEFTGKDGQRQLVITTKGYKLDQQQIDSISDGKTLIK